MSYNDDMRINRTMQKIMIDKGLKNNDIAARLDKSKQVVSNQIQKQVNWTIETMERIAGAMDCNIKIIFVDKETGKQIDCE